MQVEVAATYRSALFFSSLGFWLGYRQSLEATVRLRGCPWNFLGCLARFA